MLVTAMLIVPAATAHMLTERLSRMMLVAVIVAVLSAVVGYVSAAWLDTTVAGMMAVAAGISSLAVVFAPHHGLVSKALANYSFSLRIVSEDLLAMLYRAEEPTGKPAATLSWRHAGEHRLWRWSGSLDGGNRVVAPRRGAAESWLEAGAYRSRSANGPVAGASTGFGRRIWANTSSCRSIICTSRPENNEHFLGPQLQDRLASELHKPVVDPHGREIPEALQGEGETRRQGELGN